MEFLRSVLAQNEAITVSTRVSYDLPVNPLSHIIFTLRFLNNTGTLTDYTKLLAAISQLSNVAVDFKGTSIVNMSGPDLAFYFQVLTGKTIAQVNCNSVDNDARTLSMIIPFGRKLFDPNECFPAVKRGDLKLIIDYAAAQTGIDGLYAQIETVELLGATPKQFCKATTLSKTPAAAGDMDVDLPIGNPILGCLLFSTTVPNTAYTASIQTVKMLVDNVEYGYSQANWESLKIDFFNRMCWNDFNLEHVHFGDYDPAAAADTMQEEMDVAKERLYAYLDYDPNKDDMFFLLTEGKSRVHLRITAGDTGAIRVIPIELVGVAG